MKIGILTLPYQTNYGGILQCLALQNVLRQEGHEVEVIRFRAAGQTGVVRRALLMLSSFASGGDFVAYLRDLRLTFAAKRKQQKGVPSDELLTRCADFISTHIRYTEPVDESQIAVFSDRYEALLVGSDQVWTGFARKQLTYLFDWSPAFGGLKISYAACSANRRIPRLVSRQVRSCLSQFDALSVRDENTCRLVKESCGRTPALVADPTWLYDFCELMQPPSIEEPYIFAYILGGEILGGHRAVIDEIKREWGDMKVIAVVLPDCSLEAGHFADQTIDNATPQEWLNLLTHAAFVYTDSFHGTIFSLKYQKKFLTYYTYAQRTSRLVDLKKRFRLPTVVASVDEMNDRKSIRNNFDYKEIELLIQKCRQESLAFLRQALIPRK